MDVLERQSSRAAPSKKPRNQEVGEEEEDEDDDEDEDDGAATNPATFSKFGPPDDERAPVFRKVPMVTYVSYMAVCSPVWEYKRSAEEVLALSEGGIVQKTRTICVLQAAIASAARNSHNNIDKATGGLSRDMRSFAGP